MIGNSHSGTSMQAFLGNLGCLRRPLRQMQLHKVYACSSAGSHCSKDTCTIWAAYLALLGNYKEVQTFSWRGFAPHNIPPQVRCCHGHQGYAMAKGCSVVNGLDCRLQNSQVISKQVCRFRNFVCGPHSGTCSSTLITECP